MLTIQRNGMGPPFFAGAFGADKATTAVGDLQTSLNKLGYGLAVTGAMNDKTGAALVDVALKVLGFAGTLPIPGVPQEALDALGYLKTADGFIRDVTFGTYGLKSVLDNRLAIVGLINSTLGNTVSNKVTNKVIEAYAFVTNHATAIRMGVEVYVLVRANAPGGGGGGIAPTGGGITTGVTFWTSPKYPAGSITTKKWGKWHVAIPRGAALKGAGLGVPIYNGGTGLGIPIYNAGTGLCGPCVGGNCGNLGADPTHKEAGTEEAAPAGVTPVSKPDYEKATKPWYLRTLTLSVGTVALVGAGVGVWLLVR